MISERTMDLLKKAKTPEQFGELAYAHIHGVLADFTTAFEVAMKAERERMAKIVDGSAGIGSAARAIRDAR